MIFIRKSFVLKFLRQKGPKMRLFKSFEKSVHGYFLIFYIKLEQLKDLKLTQLIFLIKNHVPGFQTERAPKWVLLILWRINALNFSDFLHKVTAADKIMWKNVCFGVFGAPKNGPGMFFKFYDEWKHDISLIFCMKLH